jgi:hypothetical protein
MTTTTLLLAAPPAPLLLPAACPLAPSDYDYRAEYDTSEYLPVEMTFHLSPSQRQAALTFARTFHLAWHTKLILDARAKADTRADNDYAEWLQVDPNPRRTAHLAYSAKAQLPRAWYGPVCPDVDVSEAGDPFPLAIASVEQSAKPFTRPDLYIKYAPQPEPAKRILTLQKSGPAFDKPVYDFSKYAAISNTNAAVGKTSAGRSAYYR